MRQVTWSFSQWDCEHHLRQDNSRSDVTLKPKSKGEAFIWCQICKDLGGLWLLEKNRGTENGAQEL